MITVVDPAVAADDIVSAGVVAVHKAAGRKAVAAAAVVDTAAAGAADKAAGPTVEDHTGAAGRTLAVHRKAAAGPDRHQDIWATDQTGW